jgi:hypothetical protein
MGGPKVSTYVLLFSKNIFSSAQYFPKKWDWPIKVAFTNKTNKTPQKNLIKKGCTPQQINGNYKDRYLCSK